MDYSYWEKILYNGTYSLAKVESNNAIVSINMNVLIHEESKRVCELK